jgi:hypothetical protein
MRKQIRVCRDTIERFRWVRFSPVMISLVKQGIARRWIECEQEPYYPVRIIND